MALSSKFNLVRVMAVGGMVMAGASAAFALPVELTRAEFNAEMTGRVVILEDMQGFMNHTAYPSPLVLKNGTYTASNPYVDHWCGGPATNGCLGSNDVDSRSFSLFPTGTTFWGTDFFYAYPFSPGALFNITVVGVSGTTVFQRFGANPDFLPFGVATFFGFADPLGLLSISFVQAGPDINGVMGAFAFDDVKTTGGPAMVPEPATLVLLATGLAGLHWRRRTAAR